MLSLDVIKVIAGFAVPLSLNPGIYGGIGGIAASADGRIFISDAGGKQVAAFSADFEHLWYSQYSQTYQYGMPDGLRVDDNQNEVFVAFPLQILVLSAADGSTLREFPSCRGAVPSGLAVHKQKLLVTCHTKEEPCVQCWTSTLARSSTAGWCRAQHSSLALQSAPLVRFS